jgi:hypothetical protein
MKNSVRRMYNHAINDHEFIKQVKNADPDDWIDLKDYYKYNDNLKVLLACVYHGYLIGMGNIEHLHHILNIKTNEEIL